MIAHELLKHRRNTLPTLPPKQLNYKNISENKEEIQIKILLGYLVQNLLIEESNLVVHSSFNREGIHCHLNN